MYSLTKEEYEQLSLETTSVPGKPDQYLVTIEVFHQLHCLVSQPGSVLLPQLTASIELPPQTLIRDWTPQ